MFIIWWFKILIQNIPRLICNFSMLAAHQALYESLSGTFQHLENLGYDVTENKNWKHRGNRHPELTYSFNVLYVPFLCCNANGVFFFFIHTESVHIHSQIVHAFRMTACIVGKSLIVVAAGSNTNSRLICHQKSDTICIIFHVHAFYFAYAQ